MRATWVVLSALLLGGGVAYWYVRWGGGEGSSQASLQAAPPKLERVSPRPPEPPLIPPPPAAAAPAADPAEAQAVQLVRDIEAAEAARDATRAAELQKKLDDEAPGTQAAQRWAVRRGFLLQQQAEGAQGEARMRLLDRARRLLSRGVLLAELFDADGAPTPVRSQLLERIQTLNAQVMTYAPGLPGVTTPFTVPPGAAPVSIVTAQKLPYGHNALLYWNKRGNLDPRRLVAGEQLLLPQEELTLRVDIARRRLLVFLGDWFVKEFPVGVGRDDTPTPRGWFTVKKKQENPDWTRPQDGRVVRAGAPENELGSVWIHIASEQHPEHYGIHGTNKPETVGTACSQGCVRLVNEQASEIYWWVRQGSGGGPPTRVELR